MEDQKVNEIVDHALDEIEKADKGDVINNIRNNYLAKKSELMGMMSKLGQMSPEERKDFGKLINDAKNRISEALAKKQQEIADKELAKQLEKETIDVSLPGRKVELGGKNPFYIVQDELIEIFTGMGFSVASGPEVESDLFNFELLNIPKDHPARDMQDTFYIDNNTLLRTHTSPMQAHAMKEAGGKPIKIICPGKTYRRDNDDATHSHQFAQVEGLLIDKNINIGHLKALLTLFAKKMFGEKREIRFRSSYFPFTEPSVEIDISCFNCGGKGCSMCKGTGWIEILGGGMVHPNVLKMNGYDPEEYSGLAFGIGIERVAMLRYGIDDIRKLYTNDVRFLRQFEKKA